MSNEFPGNVFVSRHYPPPQAASDTYEVSTSTASEPSVTVTASESVNVGDLIDSSAAAEMLGVTSNNLRQMVHKGRLTVASKNGRKNMFSRAAVTQLREQRSK